MRTSIAQPNNIVQTGLSAAICGLAIGGFVATARAVDVWITSGDRTSLLSQKVDALFDPGGVRGASGSMCVPIIPIKRSRVLARR